MKSFTLIELIFIIVIVGLLSIGAINAIPDNTLVNNTNFLYNKILKKRANACAFEANMSKSDENESVCIVFTKQWINNDENYSSVKFKLSPRVSLSSFVLTVCFDYMGRPYDGAVDLDSFDNLLHKDVNITVSYNGAKKNIIIYPISGDVQIQ